MKRFVALFDIHYGYERRGGHKVPLHDPKALAGVMEFVKDFKPHTTIIGGDGLDCAAISHHTRHKPGQVEGLRILSDAKEFRAAVLEPLETHTSGDLVYITGNHEDWLNDVTDELPGLEGIVDLKSILELDEWQVIPQGGYYNLDKLTFVHGDQISGGENVAKSAVIAYERNIRFGHHHTYQAFTKTSAIDQKLGKTGIAVPCLCTKSPKYGEGKPNKWVQGFLWGYTNGSNAFADYVTVIVDGKFVINGKQYGGK